MTGRRPRTHFAACPPTATRCARDDRAHVFHSWSAQGLIDPLPIAGASGSFFTDYDGNRYLDFSSQLVNVNIGHQHPKLVAAIQEQADRLCTIAPSSPTTPRSEAARLITELAPGDLDQVFFTNGGAEATENALRMARLHTGRHKVIAAYRSYHGATAGAITHDRRSAPLAERAGLCPASCTSGARTRTALRSTPTTEARGMRACAAAPARPAHGRGRRTPSPRSSWRRSSAPTASWCPPDGYLAGRARALRRVRHRDDRRRGDGRVRPLRRVVRRRPLGRHARPDHLRQGRQLRLRAAGRRDHLRRDRRDLRRARLPGRAHLLGSSARVRVGAWRRSTSSRTRGSSSTPATLGTDVIGPELAKLADAAPLGRRGARARRVLGARVGARPRHPRAAGALQRDRRRRRSR